MSTHRQQGLSLLETLVAVAVLAIGLLGLAGMHLYGMRHTQSASTLSTASELAQEMAERLRANQQGVDDNRYALISLSNSSCEATPTCPGSLRSCYNSQCSVADLASADVTAWHRKLCLLMPCGATATVTCADSDDNDADSCTDGSRHDIRMQWADLDVQLVDGVRQSGTTTNRILLVVNPLNPVR